MLTFARTECLLYYLYIVSIAICLENFLYDTRFVVRTLRNSAGFSVIAILILALGIGSSTAIFSVVHGVLLNQLSYHNSERIVALAQIDAATPNADGAGDWTVAEWRMRSRSFETISLYGDSQRILVENGEGEILRGMRVSHDFFETLGVKMALGRSILADEDRWPRGNVIILSHGLWTRRFGADPRILERILALNGEPYRVIGVLPPDFQPLRMSNPAEKPQVFMPLGYDSRQAAACGGCIAGRTIGRLKPGVELEAARKELSSIMSELAREHPADFAQSASARIDPLKEHLVGPIKLALWALLGSVAIILLIACANIANLLMARGTARSKELVLRAALGCGRSRLAGQLLIESLLLSITAGVIGVLLAWQGRALYSWFHWLRRNYRAWTRSR